MNYRKIISLVGLILVIVGLAMFLPIIWSLYYGEADWPVFLLCGTITAGIGFVAYRLNRNAGDFRNRESFVVVTFGWFLASVFGSIPYLLSESLPTFADAFFETMSGFTTTGASVISNVEGLSHGIVFWRSLTHWLGGMGIVVLLVAILSSAGVGAMQMYRAEAPGPLAEKIKPRIRETARILWYTYLIFTAAATILLWLMGMSFFDALCHAFGSISTGGFATKNLSIGFYNNSGIYWVITVFCFLSGANYSLYYQALKGKSLKTFWRNEEFKLYTLIVLISTLVIWLDLWHNEWGGLGDSLTAAGFQVVTIITTTGYNTTDFNTWSPLAKGILVLLMFVGGCAGSTSGSMKTGRILVLLKQGILEIKRTIHPKQILNLRINGRFVPDEFVPNILQYFFIYLGLTGIATIVMAALGLDLVSAFTAVAATIGNIGAGLGLVGPMANYSFIPTAGKYLLSFLMLLGRLELYTVLALLVRSFWKE